MPNNAADVLRLLKTAFSNELLFLKRAIFSLFFSKSYYKNTVFPFLVPLINSDIILQESRITFYFNVFEKKLS